MPIRPDQNQSIRSEIVAVTLNVFGLLFIFLLVMVHDVKSIEGKIMYYLPQLRAVVLCFDTFETMK